MGDGKPKCIVFKIFASVLGIISGISILITFAAYHNFHAAAWGLFAAIFAGVNARLHILYRKNRLHLYYSPQGLNTLKNIGILATIVTIVAAITYFGIVVVYKEGYKLDGYMPAGIFATMTLKFTISLIFAGRTYKNYLKEFVLPDEEAAVNIAKQQYTYNSL